MSEYDVAAAFGRIEQILLDSMHRNLAHHIEIENTEGISFSQWQTEQLAALREYRRRNKTLFSSDFEEINAQIENALRTSYSVARTRQEAELLRAALSGLKKKGNKAITGSFFAKNERRLDALIEATIQDMRRAQTAMLRMANDSYRKIIFDSHIYFQSGAGTLAQAVDMAQKDFLSRGINCIEYANGARVNIAAYAQMALRTASTRAYLQGEAGMRDEWGINTVIINKRSAACPRCMRFAGKVFYDDVWSRLGAPDGKYPRLSQAIEQGLYHPNCKDIHTTFFEGISSEPQTPSQAERQAAAEQYEQEQRLLHAMRQAQRYRRLEEGSFDEQNRRRYGKRRRGWEQAAQMAQSTLQRNRNGGIINAEIDQFTPCLVRAKTGEIVQTTFERAEKSQITGLKKQGWQFNWTHPSLRHSEIYRLRAIGDERIQGLVAIESVPSNCAVHVSLVESAPHNRGKNKEFVGVGGHLFAIAAQKSNEAGYGGFLYFEAMNQELVRHYETMLGAVLYAMPHPYSMVLEEVPAQKLLAQYTMNEG